MRSLRSRLFVLGIIALLCSLGTSTAWAGHDPEVGPNVQVNDPQSPAAADFPGRNTTTLAASEDSQELLAGWDDLQGFCGPPNNRPCPAPVPPGLSGFGFSTDGGLTWTDGGAPSPIGNAQTAGHPWVDRGGDSQETFFYTSRLRVGAPAADSAGIGVYRGHFAAGTFVWDDAQSFNSANPAGDFYSRQAIAAAKDDSGAAYIALVNAAEVCGFAQAGIGRIELWRTHDAGDSWQGPVIVSPDALDITDPSDPACGITGYLQTAPVPAIGTAGEVYVIWQYGPYFLDFVNTTPDSRIAFSRSLDGGVTFEPPRFLATINNMRENPPVGYAKNRMNDQPRIAVATSGPHRGRIYVTFYQSVQPVTSLATAQSLVSSQIFIMHSDDQGETWSAPTPLAGPVPATGIKRFWPTVSVRPGGDVDVVYLESQETQVTPNPTDIECSVAIGAGTRRRTGTASSLVDTYWVQSRDGGITFGDPVRVSEVTSNWCTAAYSFGNTLYSNFGDYLGVVSGGNRTLTVWPDARNGVPDVFFAEIKGKVDKK